MRVSPTCYIRCSDVSVSAGSGLHNFADSSANVDFKTVDDALDVIPANASGNHAQTSNQVILLEEKVKFPILSKVHK